MFKQIRSEFDHFLLRYAAECGATVREETKVTEILFADNRCGNDPRPIGANYTHNGTSGSISFEYLIDASGRNGIMSTKVCKKMFVCSLELTLYFHQQYLKNRRMNKSLHNVACWSYWSEHKEYMPGTHRHNAPWFEALTGKYLIIV